MNREYFHQNLNRSVEVGVKHVFSSINAHISVLSLGTVICAISTYVNTNLSVDPFDAIFDPTGNPVFQKMRLRMVGLLIKYWSDFQKA